MRKIPPHLFKPRRGTIEAFLFANSHAGIEPTLYYNINVPLEPFDAGLPWEPGLIETDFRLDFLRLSARDWRNLDGRSFTLSDEQSDCSIYLGNSHNPVEVLLLTLSLADRVIFNMHAELLCRFEDERVGKNAKVVLNAKLDFLGLVVRPDDYSIQIDTSKPEDVRKFLSTFVDMDAYNPEIQPSKSNSSKLERPQLLLLPAL